MLPRRCDQISTDSWSQRRLIEDPGRMKPIVIVDEHRRWYSMPSLLEFLQPHPAPGNAISRPHPTHSFCYFPEFWEAWHHHVRHHCSVANQTDNHISLNINIMSSHCDGITSWYAALWLLMSWTNQVSWNHQFHHFDDQGNELGIEPGTAQCRRSSMLPHFHPRCFLLKRPAGHQRYHFEADWANHSVHKHYVRARWYIILYGPQILL